MTKQLLHATLCKGATQQILCVTGSNNLQQQQLEGDATVSSSLEPASSALPEADDPCEDQPNLPITRVCYSDGDNSKFRLWVGGAAAGQVLDCTWDQSAPLSSTVAMSDAAVTAVCRSWSGSYTVLGSMNGVVLVQKMSTHGNPDDGR
jgi:hypothetical protein